MTNSLASSKASDLVILGYSTGAGALVLFLTINGASGIPEVVSIVTACLIAIGLLVPAGGMLQMRRGIRPIQHDERNGFAMQGLGLIGLLLAVVLVVATSSLLGYLVSALIIAISGGSALLGAIFLKKYYKGIAALRNRDAWYFVLGTALIFSGVGLIAASNIAYQYFISQVENTVYVDVGATISACGWARAAHAYYTLRDRN
ncbi:MAG: hypothetical protein ACHQ1H_05635 [Nitrososphaerales archaeon]